MGVQEIEEVGDGHKHRANMQALLTDLRALELMLEKGMFESGIRRIGAEQEITLVDSAYQPSPAGPDLLERINDDRATTEIGRFNVEFNCSPLELKGSALRDVHNEIKGLMGVASTHAAQMGVIPIMVGILPTLQPEHLSLDYMTDRPRYRALNDLITAARGGQYGLRIKGTDELTFTHDNVMVEALNTSFQLHFQVEPHEFAACFNAAQAITGPVLAASANSAVLFGKRLWHETRIAIFEQIVDTSTDVPNEREMLKRVRFGEKWVEESVLELYKADIARFRSLFSPESTEDSLGMVERGEIPKLIALQTHNSTLYRWNRPCYGITDGKPHLRIENRVLPAGPTVGDEIANAALWFGLMVAMPTVYPDLTERMAFEDARSNFVAAARTGLDSKVRWIDGVAVSVRDLLLGELIPMARDGLKSCKIRKRDIDYYLGIVQARVESGMNGARWTINSVAKIHEHGTRAERLASLTAATIARQQTGKLGHEWELAELNEGGTWEHHYVRVGQYMKTDLYTVRADELIDLAASIMEWEHVRHVPVEDEAHNLVGLLSYRALLKLVSNPSRRQSNESIAVSDIMNPEPAFVSPETTTLEAIALMREHGTSCLPVVTGGKLVGIVTEHDYMRIAGQLLEEQLRSSVTEKGS
jgi:CBS domain-containing protein